MFVHDSTLTASLPVLIQCNLPGKRVYRLASGQALPSITTVLGKKPKPFLDVWRARIGAEQAALITARAAATGTALHTLSEAYLGNDPLPSLMPQVAELWQRLRPWIDQHITRVYAQECDIHSMRLGVAGRLDLLADADRELAIVDFKQSLKPKKSEWIQDYRLQGTFYACAVYEQTGRAVRKIVIPVVSPNELQVFETTPGDHFDELCDRIAYYYEQCEREAVA
jgi:hypothetical protein